MSDAGTLAASLDGAILIGAVLLEAIVLYVVYGVVEQVFGHRVVERLRTA